jgi:hypothetical protein
MKHGFSYQGKAQAEGAPNLGDDDISTLEGRGSRRPDKSSKR